MRHFQELVDRFNSSINAHENLERRLITALNDIERCSNLTGDNFTNQTRQYLTVKAK